MPSNNNSASGLMSEGNFSFFSFSAFLSKDMVGPEEGINAPVKKGSTVKLTIFHSVEVLLKVCNIKLYNLMSVMSWSFLLDGS